MWTHRLYHRQRLIVFLAICFSLSLSVQVVVGEHQAHPLPVRRTEASSSSSSADETCQNGETPLHWEEHFVVREQASATVSVGEALSKDLSYLSISKFATPTEMQTLVQAALDVHGDKSKEGVQFGKTNTSTDYIENWVTNPKSSCWRFSVESYLNDAAKQTGRTLVYRLWDLLRSDPSLQELCKRQMKEDYVTFSTLDNSELWNHHMDWYSENDYMGNPQPEPCVNLYFPPSDIFEKHLDGLSITFLLLLTNDYEGGGTQMFGYDRNQQEALVLARPPAGTLLMWGSNMLHQALPITKGMRSVFVGSFELKKIK